jgi:lipopolysaccharide/colanic/teichoic acid biosynthesis glycosyltransferase
MKTYLFFKRILDILVALTLIIVFLPIWILIPILVLVDSGWPIFFKHKRIGLNGSQFYLYKFRSMINNADKILHSKNKELLNKFKQNDWKMKASEDPRITPLGRILRSLTIDEFPQLFNVLKGDMSMVGPRAYLKAELKEQMDRYPETKKHLKAILSVKPGITGLWQVSGRNEIPFVKRAQMDASYLNKENLNIWFDLKILFRTPKAMISKW